MAAGGPGSSAGWGRGLLTPLAADSCQRAAGWLAGSRCVGCSVLGARPAGCGRPLSFTAQLPGHTAATRPRGHTHFICPRPVCPPHVFLPRPNECGLLSPAAVPEVPSTRGVPARVPGLRDHPQELRPRPGPTPAFGQPMEGPLWGDSPSSQEGPGKAPRHPQGVLVLTAGPAGSSGQAGTPPGGQSPFLPGWETPFHCC